MSSNQPEIDPQLYALVRTELRNTHVPLIKKTVDELETASEVFIPRISTLAAEVNVGNDQKMVEAMKEASVAMEKYEAVLKDAAPKLKEWKGLLGQWSRKEGPL